MVEFTEGRPRPINYQNVCHTIADFYPEGVAHGVQKDAIQNSVDARAGSAAVNVLFSLEETGKGRFLTVADSGTKGLTGPVLDQVEEYVEELPTDSHWARFESFAFTKDEPDAIGARGQGKFIFLCASSEFKMFYDTLRPDGIYRLGATQARTTGCPILPGEGEEPWEGDTAQRILWDNCELHPLTEVGTRIIIVNPTGEVVGEFESGFVTSAIRETWFREIEKERLKVAIRLGGELTEVELVSPYPVPETDSEGVQSWVLGTDFDEDTIGLATGRRISGEALLRGTPEWAGAGAGNAGHRHHPQWDEDHVAASQHVPSPPTGALHRVCRVRPQSRSRTAQRHQPTSQSLRFEVAEATSPGHQAIYRGPTLGVW